MLVVAEKEVKPSDAQAIALTRMEETPTLPSSPDKGTVSRWTGAVDAARPLRASDQLLNPEASSESRLAVTASNTPSVSARSPSAAISLSCSTSSAAEGTMAHPSRRRGRESPGQHLSVADRRDPRSADGGLAWSTSSSSYVHGTTSAWVSWSTGYRKCMPAMISTAMIAATIQSTTMQKGGHHLVFETKWVRCCQRSLRP